MGLKKGITEQATLTAAEDEGSVLDALDILIPQPQSAAELDAYASHRHQQFIEQLMMIGSGISQQMTAVRHYLQSSKMRIRWTERGLKENRLSRFRQSLFDIYGRHADANKEGREPAIVRGQRTFADTIKEANESPSVTIGGTDRRVELPGGTIEGEYHHMANGEDGVELGWHPEWKRRLETGEIND